SALESSARRLVERLQRAGFEALYAGGCVRDALRGATPADYDIATSARPEQVQALFARTVAVGAQFGVICVMDSATEFQVATFRSDHGYIDGRHPTAVTFSSPREDAERRDFTVNGMFFDPLKNEVIDFVGGRADLEAKILRAIGNASDRFREDRLRMLRAVRLATTLEFQIEEKTWAAIRANASEIKAVSAERIREEIVRTLLSPQRLRGFDLLDTSGLLDEILPEMTALKGCEQPPAFHPEGDVFVHTRKMIELLPAEASLPLVFAVLFHDIGKPATYVYDEKDQRIRFSGHDKVGAQMTESIMKRLRFSGDEIRATVEAVESHMIFKDVQNMRVARLKRFMAREHFDDELALHKLDCESSHGMIDNYKFLLEKRDEFAREPIIPPPLITGHDVLSLGHKPGPIVGEILNAAETLQLEGALQNREQALEWLKQTYPSP
ncbi:MAG: CCA tRNA nucleotidyltransferase, partial [Verrucomicrobiota bacterium]|nr:CCA tRNA nucleotidyltransferase [Verrucomicrobiota bacterium]